MISVLGFLLTTSIYIWILYMILKPDTKMPTVTNEYPDFIKNYSDKKRKYER